MINRKTRTTLVEIAKAANVSITTVSNVVNGRLHLMSDDTRRRVEAIVQQHNYRPNEEARNLRLAQRRAIGLIVVDDSPTFLADPMITNIVAGMSNYLGVNGYSLLITGMTHAAVDSAQMLRRDQTDAICIIPSGPSAERKRLFSLMQQLGQPVIVFQDDVPDQLPDAMAIRQDDEKGGSLIGGLLAAEGARRIAFLSTAQSWPALEYRQAGARRAAEEAGSQFEVITAASESISDTQQALDRHAARSRMPEAIIGGNDQMAIAAINWALDRSQRVPLDIRVAGFNGFEVFSYARPSLTTVVSPAYDMGRRGAEALLDRLSGAAFPSRQEIFDVTIRRGGSA